MIRKIEFMNLSCAQIARVEKLIDEDDCLKKNVDMMVNESWDMKNISGAFIISCRSDQKAVNRYCWAHITECLKSFL